MRKRSTVWLITAVCLMLIGLIAFGGAMMALGWDFSKISTTEYETNSYEIHESFADVSILSNTADISFVPTEDSKCAVVCYEDVKAKHSVSVENGRLSIKLADNRRWYDHISFFNFSTPKITVYLPCTEYGELCVKSSTGNVEIPNDFLFKSIDILQSTGDVANYASVYEEIKIHTSTGKILVENATAHSLDLTVSTGDVTVKNVTCEADVKVAVSTGKSYITALTCYNFVSDGDTGDIFLKDVITAGNFTIERTTGDVKFDGCDACEIFVKTDTGDVAGSLLSDKIFITETDTGRIVVPETVTGGRCKVITDTGDIKIEIISTNP